MQCIVIFSVPGKNPTAFFQKASGHPLAFCKKAVERVNSKKNILNSGPFFLKYILHIFYFEDLILLIIGTMNKC